MCGKYEEGMEGQKEQTAHSPLPPVRFVSVQTICDVNVLVFKIKLNNVMVTIIMKFFGLFWPPRPATPETKSMC